jgi:integrase
VRSPRRLPEAIDPADVSVFLTDLSTYRDRAMVLAMVLGGLRSAEVRSLRLADVDFGLRRLRVMGKGGKERAIPIDPALFAELAGYLREERPPGCHTPQCLVVPQICHPGLAGATRRLGNGDGSDAAPATDRPGRQTDGPRSGSVAQCGGPQDTGR